MSATIRQGCLAFRVQVEEIKWPGCGWDGEDNSVLKCEPLEEESFSWRLGLGRPSQGLPLHRRGREPSLAATPGSGLEQSQLRDKSGPGQQPVRHEQAIGGQPGEVGISGCLRGLQAGWPWTVKKQDKTQVLGLCDGMMAVPSD